TAPDECRRYVVCGPGTAPSGSGPSGPVYPAVHLTCAQADSVGVEDKVVNYEIDLDANGRPDCTAVWRADNPSCATDALHPEPVGLTRSDGQGRCVVKLPGVELGVG